MYLLRRLSCPQKHPPVVLQFSRVSAKLVLRTCLCKPTHIPGVVHAYILTVALLGPYSSSIIMYCVQPHHRSVLLLRACGEVGAPFAIDHPHFICVTPRSWTTSRTRAVFAGRCYIVGVTQAKGRAYSIDIRTPGYYYCSSIVRIVAGFSIM